MQCQCRQEDVVWGADKYVFNKSKERHGQFTSVHQVPSMMAVARSSLFHWAQAEAFEV